MSRQVVVVANERSRHGKSAYAEVPRLLRERGVEVLDAHLAPSRDDLCKYVKRARREKHRLIVVCGGDGTISGAAGVLAKCRTALGVIPAGTGNSFILGLGIEDSFESAANAIAYGCETKVDLGCVNGTYFTNFLTIGLDAYASDDASKPLKKFLGPAAYAAAGIIPLLRHGPFRADIRWKGHRLRAKTSQMIIANGRFFGDQPISKSASLDDGKLTVFLRDARGRFDVVQTYFALLRGDQHALSGAHLWSTKQKLELRTRPRQPVAVDGSAFEKTPLRMRVVRRALRVMVPYEGAVTALAS